MRDVKHKPSVGYYLLRFYSNTFIFRWFSKVEVNGKENIPQDGPCILLPCHQNGLMDCLTLLVIFKKPITFFAKSSLFVNRLVSNFLIFLRIMPAYRQKEGIQKVAKNEDNFLKAIDLLLLGFPFCIMPEGGQHEKHRLYPFAKGAFRVAFHAQEKLPKGKNIHLIPIGLDYGHYDKMGYPFVLSIAKPINVLNYVQSYKKNPAKTLNMIKDDAYQSLSANMLDIRSEEYYDVIYTVSYVYNFSMLKRLNLDDNLTNRLKARQIIAKHLDEIVVQSPEKLSSLADKCISWLKKTPDFVSIANSYHNPKFISVLLYTVLLFPVFLYGFLLNVLVILLIAILNPRFKGSGFSATMKYTIFVLFSPVNHLLFAALISILTSSWIISLVIFLTGMPFTVFCKNYFVKLRILKNKLQMKKHKKEI
jgi:1-acyl-sn-glycerol-3-phosphate acyltransferase